MTKEEIRALVLSKRREYVAAGGKVDPKVAFGLNAFAAWLDAECPEIRAHRKRHYRGEQPYKFLQRFIY